MRHIRPKTDSTCRTVWLSTLAVIALTSLLGLSWFALGSASLPAAVHAAPQPDEGPHLSANVTVLVSPSIKTVNDGATFDIEVRCAAGTARVDAAEVHLAFNRNYLRIDGMTLGTGLNTPIYGFSNATGTVDYVAARLTEPASTVTGNFLLFALHMRAVAPVASTPLTLNTVKVLLAGAEHVVAKQSGTVTVLAPTSTPTPSITPTPSNTPIATTVPQPTATNTRVPGVQEIVLQQGQNGYTGFEDTYISEWVPTQNYYLEWHLELRAPNLKRPLIKADVSMLPPGTQIEEAILTLYVGEESPLLIQGKVFDMLRFWDGKSATWKEAALNVDWGTDGADAVGIDRAAIPEYQRTIFPTSGTFANYPFDFDVTALVQGWVNAPTSNQGLILLSDSPANSEYAFRSSEYLPAMYRPKLTIRYTAGATFTPTPTATGSATITPTPSTTPTETLTPTPTETAAFGELTGRAFVDADGNNVLDAGEAMVQGVVLDLRRTGDPLFGATRTTTADGRYLFASLAPGRYELTVTAVPGSYMALDPQPYVMFIVAGASVEANIPLDMGGRVAIPLIFQE